jgi:hypothetical protein
MIILSTKYYYDGQIKENDMNGTSRKMSNGYNILDRNPEDKRPFVRVRLR